MAVPTIYTAGKFVLKKPFLTRDDVTYSVSALREFSDLYIKGVDVYSEYYKPYGLIDGAVVNGATFNFTAEAKFNPVIVTLEGSDDTVIYVPSTYIESYPISGDIAYSRLILSADLGALPDTVPLDSILQDVQELVQAKFGVKPEVKVSRGYTSRQPTQDEHVVLEQSRIGSIATTDNHFTQSQALKDRCEFLDAQVKTLTRILADNNLI